MNTIFYIFYVLVLFLFLFVFWSKWLLLSFENVLFLTQTDEGPRPATAFFVLLYTHTHTHTLICECAWWQHASNWRALICENQCLKPRARIERLESQHSTSVTRFLSSLLSLFLLLYCTQTHTYTPHFRILSTLTWFDDHRKSLLCAVPLQSRWLLTVSLCWHCSLTTGTLKYLSNTKGEEHH